MRAVMLGSVVVGVLLAGCPSGSTSGQTASDLPECDGAPVPGGGIPSWLVGTWQFEDATFDVAPDGTIFPNGSHTITWVFGSDGAFEYTEFISVTSDQLPTESGPCEQSVFSHSTGSAREANGALDIYSTRGSQVGQAQACGNDFLQEEVWCPGRPVTRTPVQATADDGTPAFLMGDLTQGDEHAYRRQ